MNLQRFLHSAGKKHRQTTWVVAIVSSILLLLAAVISQIANGDIIGWSHGFNHPLEGWDHLVTMLAVGIWAAQMRGHSIWLLPLSFVGVMSLGGFAGAIGLSIPSVEGIILLSTAVFSILVTRKIRFSTKMNVLIVAFFAFFHGFAHGQEISTSASLLSYTVGFMLATLLLHGAGILLAKLVLMSIACLMSMIFSIEVQANFVLSQTQTPDFASASVFNDLGRASEVCNSTRFHAGYLKINHSINSYDLHTDAVAFSTQRQQSNSTVGIVQTIQIDKSSQFLPGMLAQKSFEESIDACNTDRQLYFLNDFMNFVFGSIIFNDYYPDINHSPGTDLLSSGVGLHSPPTSTANLLKSPVVSHFAIPFFPTLEVQSLLMTNSKVPNLPTLNATKMLRSLCCACLFDHSHDLNTSFSIPRLTQLCRSKTTVASFAYSNAFPFIFVSLRRLL